MIKIDFNVPPCGRKYIDYIQDVVTSKHICGDGIYTKKCSKFIEERLKVYKCLLTTSGTHALEMGAYLSNVREGDEVIMPSYTFASTADAFVMRGARAIFVDIRPDTLNIDEKLIEAAITDKTKAICVVHYAGVVCEMDKIMELAKKYNLMVIEDAAQAIFSTYKGKAAGTIGDVGCLSFHETKNLSMGEGGALLFNDEKWLEPAEILREKGTDRSKFYRGEVDKYSWVGIGSSYLPSELNAAYLWAQLEQADEIHDTRMNLWNNYKKNLTSLAEEGKIQLPFVPNECEHNAHMFYIKVKDETERSKLIEFLKSRGIRAVFHYVPLHGAPSGRKYGTFIGEDRYTTKESLRLLRLPLHMQLREDELEQICEGIRDFYK